jgi:hypothetical protein
MSTQHQITAQERALMDAALQRLKSWADTTVGECKANDLSWESSKTVLMTCIVHALQLINPENVGREEFLELMGKCFDAYHKQDRRSLQ